MNLPHNFTIIIKKQTNDKINFILIVVGQQKVERKKKEKCDMYEVDKINGMWMNKIRKKFIQRYVMFIYFWIM